MRTFVFLLGTAVLQLAAPASIMAADSDAPVSPTSHEERPAALDRTPQTGYAVSAFGSGSGSVGVSAGTGVSGGTGNASGREVQGSLTVFGAPVDRFTLLGTAERRGDGTYAPSAGVIFRVLGSRTLGWALGLGAKYRTEGFAKIDGEVELGAFASYARGRLRADANAVVGAGFEEGESDAELRLRVGLDVSPALRIGFDGQARYRVAGSRLLAGARHWDVLGGPQIGVSVGPTYASVTVGPSTVDVASGVGWTALASVGAVSW
jgi:hypothetical protein